jgi:hypothetical protein
MFLLKTNLFRLNNWSQFWESYKQIKSKIRVQTQRYWYIQYKVNIVNTDH